MVIPENRIVIPAMSFTMLEDFTLKFCTSLLFRKYASVYVSKTVNASEGTNKKRSPIVQPVVNNKLLVGSILIKKNKTKKETIGFFFH
jgi:hypothetical protein